MKRQPTDTELAARVALLADRRAFGLLVGRYQSRLRRFFLGQTLGDEQLSDDLAQETFIKAWLGLAGFRGLASFSTWLYRIAYRVLLDHARSRRPTLDIDSAPVLQRAADSAEAGLGIDVYRALALLRPEERTCITLQLIDGQSLDKIAQITGLPVNTVKSHLHRGKERLADYLRKNGYDKQRR